MHFKKIISLVVLMSCLIGCSGKSSQTQESVQLIESQLEDDKLYLEKSEELNSKKPTNEKNTNVVDVENSQEAEKNLEKPLEDSVKHTQELDVHNAENTVKSSEKVEEPDDLSLQEQVTSGITITQQIENQVVVQEDAQSTNVEIQDEKAQHTVNLSISCSTILNNKDQFNSEKLELLPVDGVILNQEEMTYEEGETVFDVLVRATKDNKIHMEYTGSSTYNTNYIEGIHNIYEFDCGPLSGWMYKVNDVFPNYGCSNYILKDGDVIEWVYTCDLGKDVGGSEMFREGAE